MTALTPVPGNLDPGTADTRSVALVGSERSHSGSSAHRRVALLPDRTAEEQRVHIPEALAFAALADVGKDEASERTWRLAIRDKKLSASIRSDLIEDLNDTGYPDPDKLTMEDLPLILYRLRVIERLYPHAMDQVNATAFEEAYMDLLNMWVRLISQQGKGSK